MNIKVKEQTPSLTMGSIIEICKELEVKNAKAILDKIHACSVQVEDKLIIDDLVSYQHIAAVSLKAGFDPIHAITQQDCIHAMRNFNDVNTVIDWLTSGVIEVMSAESPN